MSFFNDEILKILFRLIVKILNAFALRFIYLLYHIMLVPHNALLYFALIRLDKRCKNKKRISHNFTQVLL